MTGHTVWENIFIPLADGRRLAARVWMPDGAENNPVPAVFEYIPYRKRDGTAPRDESTYPVFAEAGFAGVRVDLSGNGESDGDWDDEYSPRELSDGVEVIHWIAAQNWCSGSVGMMGISWGGFNGLQIAALQPEPLKAVISIGSTVDRFNDDIHYKGGAHLSSNFGWSSVMLSYASRAPDPELVGDQWRDMWLNRLKSQPFPLDIWLRHQAKDAYWKHGSISEDYSRVRVPCLVISGWGDGYINAPPACAEHLPTHSKAINGPWIHKYPHFAYPHPRIDFHKEAIRWWGQWLRGEENACEDIPAYRAYISEDVAPGGWREREPGRWVAEPDWPPKDRAIKTLYLGKHGHLTEEEGPDGELQVRSPLECGMACGEFFSLKPDADLPGDQTMDDAGSLTFDTAVLEEGVEILGRPVVRLRLSIDGRRGNIAVRLNDVRPDGQVNRVSLGILNLAHRQGNEAPELMTPGELVDIAIPLDECGYRFLPGHRMRIAISTQYWPFILPQSEDPTATIVVGSVSALDLPTRSGGDDYTMPEPDNPDPLPQYKSHVCADDQRWVEHDLQTGVTRYRVMSDTGESEMPEHGLCTRHVRDETWIINPNDPLSARATSTYTSAFRRGHWSVKTIAYSTMRCDGERYYLSANVSAFEGDELIHERTWETEIERDWL
ncbi:CocE/NonD family hydrolase [Coralliovum pocilloporae]|uniref:CocE/NonD family hydrolase n=1 Tax=Coralliovum pocilloporae TaxID=3066369 RepID=UPI003307459C